MKYKKLFLDESVRVSSSPVYSKEKLIPDELDFEIYKLLRKAPGEFRHFCDNLCDCLLQKWNDGHGIFSSNLSHDEIIEDIQDLIMEDAEENFEFVNGKTIITHRNRNFTNQWFPELSDVRINGKSLIDQLRDKNEFHNNMKDLIFKDRLKAGEKSFKMAKLSNFLIDNLRITNGYQPAFNFPVSISKMVYMLQNHRYNFQDEIYVMDLCAGWAGRFAGLLAAACTPVFSDKKIHFICTDVNTSTFGRFESILDYWTEHINSGLREQISLYRSFEPAETIFRDEVFSKLKGKMDFGFTSPPYFSKEAYSLDEGQSYLRYKTYDEWRDNFLFGFINNSYQLLKKNREFWLNITDIKTNKTFPKYYPIVQDSIDIAKSVGFKYIDTYYMIGNKFPGGREPKYQIEIDKKFVKYEPILLFKK